MQRGDKLGAAKSHLPAPILSRIEPISETEMMLYWEMMNHSSNIDGFYAYYRPSTSAGEYSKATVDGHLARSFKIDHLEPGTVYEFKLQSFTASAASDFSAILTKKTHSKIKFHEIKFLNKYLSIFRTINSCTSLQSNCYSSV